MTQATQPEISPVIEPIRVRDLRFGTLLAFLVITLLISTTLAISIGPVPIPTSEVWNIAAAKVGLTEPRGWSQSEENIVWLIRFPRVLLSVIIGAGIAVVGTTMQALVRNPLADPYLLGVSSGASLGAVLAIGLGAFAFAGLYAVSFGAFAGALLAFLIVFVLGQQRGRLSMRRLILAGLAVSFVFQGLVSFITLTSDNRQLAGQMLAWTMGSLARAKWFDLTLPTLVLLLGCGYLVLQARSLNALLVGDETAITLGIDLSRFRRQLFVLVSLLTGVMVAVSGPIGFIGLMVPHLVRMWTGSDHRRVLPFVMLIGSIFLIWVDVFARTAFNPTELPVGMITTVLGGPFFLWLMWYQDHRPARSAR